MSDEDPDAWTLGNPLHYDPRLEEGDLRKARGGAVFLSLEDARDAMVEGRHGTYMPESWFPDAGPVPAAVYGLRLEDPERQVGDATDEVGARRLLWSAPILGRVE